MLPIKICKFEGLIWNSMKRGCVLLVVFALLLPLLAGEARKGGVVGGWKLIDDPKDPHVVEIGQFAVAAYNRQSKAGLKFERVEKGETQVVSGTNYHLVLAAKDGTSSKKYDAVVWDKPWEHVRNLISFKPAV